MNDTTKTNVLGGTGRFRVTTSPGIPSWEIRRRNFNALLVSRGLDLNEVARKIGSGGSHLRQVLVGQPKTLGSGTVDVRLGDKLCRKIEKAYKLPDYWLDSPQWLSLAPRNSKPYKSIDLDDSGLPNLEQLKFHSILEGIPMHVLAPGRK